METLQIGCIGPQEASDASYQKLTEPHNCQKLRENQLHLCSTDLTACLQDIETLMYGKLLVLTIFSWHLDL